MGKLGRFACIFVPMALTIISLVCLLMVASGQLNKDNKIQRDIYFMKADTSDFNDNPKAIQTLNNLNIDNNLLAALQKASSNLQLEDFYTVGLWNYCWGDEQPDGKQVIKDCSPRKNSFWFDPVEVWKLNQTGIFDDKMDKALNAAHKFAGWMFASYMIAIVLTVAEFLVGLAAIFSRWGSLVTTIVSTAQSIFVFAAAVTSTALYGSEVGIIESTMKVYNIHASLGKNMMAWVWLAVAFSTASGFFWTISICCCSGKSPHKKIKAEKTPYTYERVASPYVGASAGPAPAMAPPAHSTSGSAYEPFRHERV